MSQNSNTSRPSEAAQLIETFERELAALLAAPAAINRHKRAALYRMEIARYRALAGAR